MKVKCTHCNKKFDVELHGGICPHCGTIYRSKGSDDTSYESTDYLSPESDVSVEKKIFAETKTQEKEFGKDCNLFKSKINICLLVMAFLIPFAGYSAARYSNNQSTEQRVDKETVKPVQIQMNKEFSCALSDVDYCRITITGATVDDSLKSEVPEGYEMLVVSYEVHTPMTDEETEYTENPADYHCAGIYPYLVTKEQYYLKPLSCFDVSDAKGWEYEDREKNGLSETLSYRNGIIYYLVKKNDADGLWITEYDEEDTTDYDLRYVESYQLNKLEVIR